MIPFIKKHIFIFSGYLFILGCLVALGIGVDKASQIKIDLPDARTGARPKLPLEDFIRAHGEQRTRERQFAPRIELYRKMLKAQPDSLPIKKQLAMSYFYVQDYAKATALLEELKETNLADATLFYALARIAWEKGDPSKAQNYLDSSLQINPQLKEALKLSEEMKFPGL